MFQIVQKLSNKTNTKEEIFIILSEKSIKLLNTSYLLCSEHRIEFTALTKETVQHSFGLYLFIICSEACSEPRDANIMGFDIIGLI